MTCGQSRNWWIWWTCSLMYQTRVCAGQVGNSQAVGTGAVREGELPEEGGIRHSSGEVQGEFQSVFPGGISSLPVLTSQDLPHSVTHQGSEIAMLLQAN